jgi:hypothetical protein
MLPNYYFDLDIPANADLQSIKKAYRAKAIVSHPDHGGSHEAMLRINEAYEILGNPVSRRHYDEARTNKYNQAVQLQARADAAQAKQQAKEYPREWTDFETWLANDFMNAKYGQEGIWPTVENSSSGSLFILIGIFAGAIAAFIFLGNVFNGRDFIYSVLLGGAGGGFVGQWIHKQVGKSMSRPVVPKPPISESENHAQCAPQAGNKIIIRCPKCSRQLRVPTSSGGVQVRCPSCRFQFGVEPPAVSKKAAQDPTVAPSAKKNHMKKTGCLLIVLVIITVVAVAAWYDHEFQIFETNRQEVMQNCEKAIPVFKKRFNTIDPLLQLYEKHYGWENGVFKGNPNNLKDDFGDANSDVIDSTKLTPELKYSQPVQAGLARLYGGGGALDNFMGALDINDSLAPFLEAANQCSEINTGTLLSQLKSDLADTDHEMETAVESVKASIDKFNDSLNDFPESMVAKQFDLEPINRGSVGISVPATWSTNN